MPVFALLPLKPSIVDDGIAFHYATLRQNRKFYIISSKDIMTPRHGRIVTVGLCDFSESSIIASNDVLLDLVYVSNTPGTRKSWPVSFVE